MAYTDMALNEGAALSAFLTDVRSRATRIAWMEVRDSAVAGDLVQDAMLRLVQHYAHRPSEEWIPLFYRILRNRIADWRRRRRVESIVEFLSFGSGDEDEEIPDYPDPAPGPESRVFGAQIGQRISDALGQLPARQREVFLLRECEGFSVAEAALAMGVGEGSVKTHHFRALSRLRVLLREDNPDEEGCHGDH